MKKTIIPHVTSLTIVFLVLFSYAQIGNAQGFDRIEKERMKGILNTVKNEVKKNYYDPAFHGIDLDARFKKADEKLDTATSTAQALSIIAQCLIDFNDSHLYLQPPPTTLEVEYGWRMQAIGDKVFITQVKPKSDAEAKGLKPGDQVLSVSGFRPSRKELWKVLYYYNTLSKRDKLTLSILHPGETTPRDLEITSQLQKQPQNITFTTYFLFDDPFYNEENYKHRLWNLGNITIWKMPSFALDPLDAEGLLNNVKSDGTLIMDLRGNGGGYVVTLERLVGNLFTQDMKIADLKGRKPMDPMKAKARGKGGFTGQLIVLIDSGSGSASEIFARTVQLEKRGKVIGDVSAGAVMQAKHFDEDAGSSTLIPFGISITNADVIMSDGKSLEHVGVVPDELILPTGTDLAAGYDPALARAVELAGGKLSAEAAGKYAKYYWK